MRANTIIVTPKIQHIHLKAKTTLNTPRNQKEAIDINTDREYMLRPRILLDKPISIKMEPV